jgi:Sec7-like guanine-nucleotide exchange factor
MAIRRFVASSFGLPKEAQKIGRVMEAFAHRYYETDKSGIFADAGTFFFLSQNQAIENV